MDRQRVILAVFLMLLVWLAPMLLWPPKPPASRPDGRTAADTSLPAQQAPDTVRAPVVRPSGRPADASDTGRIVWVTSPLYKLGFSTVGGRLVSAELLQHQSFAKSDSAEPVELVPPDDAFLRHRLVLASGDTVSLADWSFRPVPEGPGVVVYAGQGQKSLRFEAERAGSRVTLEYRFIPEEYRFDVQGSITGLSSGAELFIDLADGLR